MSKIEKKGFINNLFKRRRKSTENNSFGSNQSIRSNTSSKDALPSFPYVIDDKDLPTFFKAILREDLVKVKKLMSTNYNKVDKEKRTALHIAAAKGNLEIIRELIVNYQNELISKRDKKQKTPLYIAVEKGILENVSFIFEKTDRKDVLDENGNGLVHAAVINRNGDILSFLLKNEIPSFNFNNDGYTPLHLCAEYNFAKGVSIILEFSSKTMSNIKDKNDESTSLIIAAKKGHHECLSVLLNFEANYDITDKAGNTALYYAKFYDNKDCFQLLKQINEKELEYKIDTVKPPPSFDTDVETSIVEKVDSITEADDIKSRASGKSFNDTQSISESHNKPFSGHLLQDISTPSLSFPNPSDKRYNETPLDDDNDDEESQWSTDSVEVEGKGKLKSQHEKQSTVKIQPIEDFVQMKEIPAVAPRKKKEVIREDSDWDNSDTDYVQVEEGPTTVPRNKKVIKEDSDWDNSDTDVNINSKGSAPVLMNNDNYEVNFDIKSPVPYENSQELLDSAEEDNTFSDLKETQVINTNYISSDGFNIAAKPPKSPSTFINEADSLPLIKIEDYEVKRKSSKKMESKQKDKTFYCDNLSYTSTEIDSRQDSLVDSENIINSERKSIQEYMSKCSKIESRLRVVESERDGLMQKVSTLTASRDKMESERNEIQQKYRKLEELKNDGEEELSDLKAKFAEAEEQLKKREKEIYDLKLAKQEIENQYNDLERKSILSNSKIKKMEEEEENLRNKLNMENDGKNNQSVMETQYESEKKQLLDRNEALSDKIKELENEIYINKENMKKSTEEYQSEMNNSKKMLASLKIELKEKDDDKNILNAEINQLKETIKQLSADMEASIKSSVEIDRLENENKRLQKELECINEEKKTLGKVEAESKQLRNKADSIEDDFLKEKVKCQKLEFECKRFENESKEFEKLLKIKGHEVKEKSDKLLALETEISKLNENNQCIIENLNRTISAVTLKHPEFPELYDILQDISKSINQKQMNNYSDYSEKATDQSLELTRALSQIKLLQDELDTVRTEYQRSMEQYYQSKSDNINDPQIAQNLKIMLNTVEVQLRYMNDMFLIQQHTVEKLAAAVKENQKDIDKQNRISHQKSQECERLISMNGHLNQSIKEEKVKNQINTDKDKSLSNQLRMEIKRVRQMRELLEGVKEILEKFNKELEYPVNLMVDPINLTSQEPGDADINHLYNLPRLCSRMLEYLRDRNEELKANLKRSEKLKENDGVGIYPQQLQNQIKELTQTMETQRQNRERLEKIRDETEFQLRSELYQLRQKSTMEVNELLDSNTQVEKERSKMVNEIRNLTDQLEKERQMKDVLTEQLLAAIKQSRFQTPFSSVFNLNGQSQGYHQPNGYHIPSPNSNTVTGSASIIMLNKDADKKALSNSLFNIPSAPKSLGPEDEELRNHLRQELDRSITRHLASGKPIRHLNIKERLKTINAPRYPVSSAWATP